MIYDYKCNPVNSMPKMFYFSLNPNDSSIIQNGCLVLENVFKLKRGALLSLDQLENSIVFLDGFDELYIKLQETDCKDINDFIKRVLQYAQENHFKAVITSRKSCVNTNDRRLFHKVPIISLAELTKSQQENWIKKYNALFENKYDIDNLKIMYQNRRLSELIKIPILFQLIVDNRVDLSIQNLVGLYHDIFKKIVIDRGHIATINIYANDVQEQLEQIAYSIFHDTDKYTFIEEKELKEQKPIKLHAIISFYLYNKTENESSSKHVIEFVHRSFYQYFLAYYIYHALEMMKKKKEIRAFLKSLCYRRLDIDTLGFVEQIAEYEKKDFKDEDIQIVLEQIENMDTWCIFHGSEDKDSLNDELKQPYMKQTIVLSNMLSVLCYLKEGLGSFLDISEREKLIALLRLFETKGNFPYIKISSHSCEAYLKGAKLGETNLERADLSRVDLREANLRGAYLVGANLNKTDLSEANLREAYLRGADLREANLIGTNLFRTDLSGANLGEANLGEAYLVGADLREANLKEADLIGAYLRRANLIGANLNKTNLSGANLKGAYLVGADLREANLDEVNLKGVDLKEADLRGAYLIGADSKGIDLSGANLEGTKINKKDLEGLCLDGVDLSKAIIYE